jgi:uncharacterized protein (TIGR00369 family)
MDVDQTASEQEAGEWKQRELPGFIGTAGPLWTRRETSGWAYGVQAGAQHLNPAGVVHGGVLLTLLDHAISVVAWEASGRQACMTVQLDTHFLAAAREGELLEARAEVAQRTKSLVFMRGTVTAAGRLVASAQSVMKVVASAP